MKRSVFERRSSGQAIAEGAAGMVCFTITAVLIVMLGVNLVTFLANDTKLGMVADATAKIATERAWFLGMERQSAANDISKAKAKARRLAQSLAKDLGLPELSEFEFSQDRNGDRILTRTKVSVSGLKLPYNLGVVPTLSICKSGLSTSYAYTSTALTNFETPDGRGVQLPSYFYFRETGSRTIRNEFGGGGSLNTELGTYFSGFNCQGTLSEKRYLQGFNGVNRSSVPTGDGASHGTLAPNTTFQQ